MVLMTLEVSLLYYQMTANSAVNRNLAGVIDNWTNLYLASIGSKDFSMEFQIGKLSEEHQKYNRNIYTHTPTHTYTHTYTHTHTNTNSKKDSQLQ